ncbi:MBL fold metallo-hydrolase [Mycobacterium sp. LTG2003]
MTPTPARQPAVDPVRQPTLRQCCSAFAGMPTGLLRPRRPDRDLLGQLVDAGLPLSSQTVKLSVLQQIPRSFPTAGVVEGVRSIRPIAIAMTAFVIEHPQARFVVDPGICTDVRSRAVSQLPAILRVAVKPPIAAIPTAESLRAFGGSVDFALPTHLHWDHVCGLLDLPSLALHVHQAELDWADTGPIAPVGGVRDALRERPVNTFRLDGPPVLTFARSHDLFGDGSVLIVDLPGHTPGHVGLLTNTVTGPVLLAGDAAWHTKQIDLIRQKASYPGALADEQREEAFRTLHRLHMARNRVRIVPTHDHAAAEQLAH